MYAERCTVVAMSLELYVYGANAMLSGGPMLLGTHRTRHCRISGSCSWSVPPGNLSLLPEPQPDLVLEDAPHYGEYSFLYLRGIRASFGKFTVGHWQENSSSSAHREWAQMIGRVLKQRTEEFIASILQQTETNSLGHSGETLRGHDVHTRPKHHVRSFSVHLWNAAQLSRGDLCHACIVNKFLHRIEFEYSLL